MILSKETSNVLLQRSQATFQKTSNPLKYSIIAIAHLNMYLNWTVTCVKSLELRPLRKWSKTPEKWQLGESTGAFGKTAAIFLKTLWDTHLAWNISRAVVAISKKSSGKSADLSPKRFETVAAGCGSGYPTRSTFGCCRFVLLQFWQIFVSQFRQIDLAIRVSIVDKYISETSSEGPGGRARSTFCRRRRSTFYSMLPRCSRDVSVKTTFVIILGDLWCLGELQKGDQQCISSLNCHVFVACY